MPQNSGSTEKATLKKKKAAKTATGADKIDRSNLNGNTSKIVDMATKSVDIETALNKEIEKQFDDVPSLQRNDATDSPPSENPPLVPSFINSQSRGIMFNF